MYSTSFIRNMYHVKEKILEGEQQFSAQELLQKFQAQVEHEPWVFNIETTSHCNMSCVMCQRTTDFQRTPQHMSWDTYRLLVSQLRTMDAEESARWDPFVDDHLRKGSKPSENNFYFDVVSRSVTMHGFGEPLLDPMLPQRVSLLSECGIPSYFSCNPCNIRLSFIEQLFDAGLGHIKFAIDSLDDEKARQIRGGKADFTKSNQKIHQVLDLKKQGGYPAQIVLTMLDFSGELGPDSEASRFMELYGQEDAYTYVKSIDNRWLLDQKGDSSAQGAANRSHYAKQYCEFPWTSLTVLADGTVVPCTQDINATCALGNLHESSLQEIWQGDQVQELRRKHITGEYGPGFMCHEKCDLNLIHYFLR